MTSGFTFERMSLKNKCSRSYQQPEGRGSFALDPIAKFIAPKKHDRLLMCCCGEVVTIHRGSWLNPTTPQTMKCIFENWYFKPCLKPTLIQQDVGHCLDDCIIVSNQLWRFPVFVVDFSNHMNGQKQRMSLKSTPHFSYHFIIVPIYMRCYGCFLK